MASEMNKTQTLSRFYVFMTCLSQITKNLYSEIQTETLDLFFGCQNIRRTVFIITCFSNSIKGLAVFMAI